MEELKNEINQVFSEQTGICSKVSRQIVFALFAVIWALSYHDGKLNFTTGSYISIAFLVIYLIVDISQYFYTAVAYRNYFFRLEKTEENNLHPLDEILLADKRIRTAINKLSFILLVVKILLLPFAFGSIIYTLVSRL